MAIGNGTSSIAKWPRSGALIFVASMYSSGGKPYQHTPASTSGTFATERSVSAPPMQNPVTPTFALDAFRCWTAPRTSWPAASPKLRLVIRCSASFASTATLPR